MKKIYRILDANVNRASEGIRVVEDICRFYFENETLTEKLRNIRHNIRKSLKDIDIYMIEERDSEHDIGKNITLNSVIDKKDSVSQIITANFKRALEAVRVIEEILKTLDNMYLIGKKFETIRYELYYLEKDVTQLINKKIIPEGIYGITMEESSNGKNNIEIVKEMIENGIKIIQYREKRKSFRDMYKEGLELRQLTKENGVTLIINDYIELAMMLDADGVHIGQDDWPIEEVRKLIGSDKIIGVSTHSKEDAIEAVKNGADYLGVGPIFKTNTKDYKTVGFEYLEFVSENIKIPFVAIGGIKENNLEEIVKRGATRIALVTEITGAENMNEKIGKLNEIIKK
ncbi:thiamine phosphate synthase [Haliovirga abyssi]|uniref:Thiamine-phosphate synthase n=1 Tax=Haliovirga abyssi TaxID=2996794 RepID=A0AAU9DYF4_9FUSO|nr:thiamine phosphate synthase [Haliovirga abyssi]BDU51556.1 hypothetical protein HLVA_21250 [Haliovirga abyssi]